MSFFGNVAINRVNLHYAMQQFAQTAGGIFFLVYMLKAGVPVAPWSPRPPSWPNASSCVRSSSRWPGASACAAR